MARLVKIIDNKYVQIEEYRNPNICFNTNEYSDFEDYCTLRETIDPFEMFYENQELQQENQELKDRIGKTIEYIEKDTRWFDSEYASIYGTLCTCAGAKDNRLEVMVNPSNLLEILKEVE